jgi:hypothetical protein
MTTLEGTTEDNPEENPEVPLDDPLEDTPGDQTPLKVTLEDTHIRVSSRDFFHGFLWWANWRLSKFLNFQRD